MSEFDDLNAASEALNDDPYHPPPAPDPEPGHGRLRRWTGLLRRFLVGQIALQVVNFVAGFLLLRWLSKSAYAQFSLAFAFQSTMTMLTDLGFTNSIVALVGARGDDSRVVDAYVRAAWRLRGRMFVIMTGVTLVAFPIVTRNQPWTWVEKGLLLFSILVALFAQGFQMYQAPIVIRGKLDRLYLPQALAGLWRVVGGAVFYVVHILNGWLASWISSVASIIIAFSFRRVGTQLLGEAADSTKDTKPYEREMLQYLFPLMPGLLFTAFQGQLSLFLITYFGNGTHVAEAAALGRLGQLFTLLGAFNGVVIEPYIARVAPNMLVKRYLLILLISIVLSCILTGAAYAFPDVLLLILGSKYHNLRPLIPILVISSCGGYVAGVVWSMNSGRRWVFWWYTYLFIAIIVVAQIASVKLFDLGQVYGAIMFNLVTSFANLVAHLCGGIYGLAKKRTPPEHGEPAGEGG